MGRFIFSRLVADDAATSKKHKNAVAPLLERAHLVVLAIAVCLIALGQADAQFAQQGSKLVGTGAVGSPVYQGFSASLSSDGNTAIIGGRGDNSNAGAAWVFTRSGGAWTQQGSKLVGTGAVGGAEQAFSVSLSSDGNTAIVGGRGDNSNVGATWVWTRSGGVWTQQGSKLVGTGAVGSAQQGTSVSLASDGNTAIVSGFADNSNVGATWVWTRSGGVWTQQGSKLVGTGAVGGARQGISVSLSSDGNTAIVGGHSDNTFAGAAWVWTRSGGVWTQQGSKLVGTGAVGSARQGYSVSLSSDGNTAIVGGYADNSNVGATWVWTRSGGVWTQQGSKLVGTGAVGGARQGLPVSLSSDGNTAIVGGSSDSTNAGAAWIWTRSGGVWTQQGSKLVGTGAVGSAQQGTSVFLSSDGNTAIVGGLTDNGNAGAAWIYATPNAPLPVELVTLSATSTNNGVELQWRTATEVDNSGWDVERREISDFGLSIANWKNVRFVSGSGTITSPHQYSFIDQNLSPGRYAYRLKQIDRTGKFSYTPEMTVEVGMAPREFSLNQNYPNPFNPTTTIEFTVPNDGRATLKVYNTLGQEVTTLFDGVAKAGEYHQVAFDGSRMASGVYFTRVEFGGKQLLKKMLLLK